MKTITSLSQYIDFVHSIHESKAFGLLWAQRNIWYRGQENAQWDLKPSLFRNGYSPCMEHNLLQLASREVWSAISNCKTNLEQLVYFQHYGLPTRLLDITSNPLVALYFACQPHKKNGKECRGKVYYFYNPTIADTNVIEKLCSIIFKRENKDMYDSKTFNQLDEYVLTTHHFILPPFTNERIEVQNGAFLMSALYDKKVPKPYPLFSDYIQEFNGSIIIAAHSKARILDELAECDIHTGTLFPDPEHKLRYVREKTLKN
jgi:hypothetical protein